MPSKTELVREFYRTNPYPGSGFLVNKREVNALSRYCRKPGRYLDAGCGTGNRVAAAAKLLPHLEFWAIDISEPSLKIAQETARSQKLKVNFQIANLMEPLPFGFKFDYIYCTGVLHHLESPERGLRNLAAHLSVDGHIFIHLYGEDHHRRRFQMKEMLDIMLPDCRDPQKRFEYYLAYVRNRKRSLLKMIYHFSLSQGLRYLRKRNMMLISKLKILFTNKNLEVTERWIDSFAHPNERTYNTLEINQLLGDAGLEIVEMFELGRYQAEYLPVEWKGNFDRLKRGEQYRIMELLNPHPVSFFFAARRSH